MRSQLLGLSFFRKLWDSFKRRDQGAIAGSPYPLGYGLSTNYSRRDLDVPEVPLRYVQDDRELTSRLLEIYYYSKEASKSIELLALNIFQSQDGGSGSWRVAEELADGSKVNTDVIAIARDLSSRTDGEEMVLGGDVLQNAVLEALFYGDSFFQLGIEKEGLRNGDWGIKSSIYMPPLSMFVQRDESGKLLGYYQQQLGGVGNVTFHPFKMLQFSFLRKKGTRYGRSFIRTQAYSDWDNVRDAEYAIAKAAMEVGVTPWLHIMPEGKTQQDLQQYERRHQEALNSGLILTNYYLMNSADIRKAASDSDAIAPLAQHLLDCRRRMIPAGFPAWIFTELGYQSSVGNDLNGQPAMTYAQIISAVRSLVGQQIKKAITIELLLRKGFDWVQENGKFEITWEPWIVTPGQLALKELTSNKEK
jgi:hypothetical protein